MEDKKITTSLERQVEIMKYEFMVEHGVAPERIILVAEGRNQFGPGKYTVSKLLYKSPLYHEKS